MTLRRALFIAAYLLPLAAGSAAAQSPWPQQPGAAPAPWPQQQLQPQQPLQQPTGSPWSQPQQDPACVQNFIKLRDDAQKKGQALQQASQRKATPVEACRLFNNFSAAEAKLIKYAQENQTNCQIPPEAIKNMTQGHAKTTEIRTKVCEAAARPPVPAGPSLSEALGSGAIPDANNIKTGRGAGTYDTLTGSPLGGR
jgi:hypothetical protein